MLEFPNLLFLALKTFGSKWKVLFDIVAQVWGLDPCFDDTTKCISFKLKILKKKLTL